MKTEPKDLQQRAEMAATKAERERDKGEATREYEAERQALLANTLRLRALRLAKEAADAEAAKTKKPVKKKAVAKVVAEKAAVPKPATPRKSRKKAAAVRPSEDESDDASFAE